MAVNNLKNERASRAIGFRSGKGRKDWRGLSLTNQNQLPAVSVRGDYRLAERLDPEETVTFEEVLMSNVIEQEALVNLLEKKGIITKAELLDKKEKLRDKQKG